MQWNKLQHREGVMIQTLDVNSSNESFELVQEKERFVHNSDRAVTKLYTLISNRLF